MKQRATRKVDRGIPARDHVGNINLDLLAACRDAQLDCEQRYPEPQSLAPPPFASTAAFNPFSPNETLLEEDASQSQLAVWIDSINATFDAYKSPLTAAEVILQRLEAVRMEELEKQNAAGTQRGTQGKREWAANTLPLSTALLIVQRCAPHMGNAGELLQFIVTQLSTHYWISQPVSVGDDETVIGSMNNGGGVSGRAVQRLPYFNLYFRVRDMFVREVERSVHLRKRVAAADFLLNRSVHRWDKPLAKICFAVWHAHQQRVRAKRAWYRTWRAECNPLTYLPAALQSWRQYARRKMIVIKSAANEALVEELEELTKLEETVQAEHQTLHDQVQTESLRRNRVMEDVSLLRSRMDLSSKLLKAYKELSVEQQRQWEQVKELLLSDVNTGNGAAHDLDDESADETAKRRANITDTTATLVRRAERLSTLPTVNIVGQLLNRVVANANSSFSQDTRSSPVSAYHDSDPMAFPNNRSQRAPIVLRVMSELSRVVRGIIVPVTVRDFVVADERRMQYLTSWLRRLEAGGYCSLYASEFPLRQIQVMLKRERHRLRSVDLGAPADLPSTGGGGNESNTWANPGTASGTAQDSSVAQTQEEPLSTELATAAIFESVVQQTASTVAKCPNLDDRSRRALLALRRWISQVSGKHEFGSDVRRFYELLKRVLGEPLPRDTFERAVKRSSPFHVQKVLPSMYPDGGIRTHTEFATYITNVAELQNTSTRILCRDVESNLELQPIHLIKMQLSDPRVVSIFKDHARSVAELFTFFASVSLAGGGEDGSVSAASNTNTDGRAGGERTATGDVLRHSRVLTIIGEAYHCNHSDVEELFEEAQQNDLLTANTFPVFVAVAAMYTNPSPFIPLDDKIRTFIHHCSTAIGKLYHSGG